MNRGYVRLWRKSLDKGWIKNHKLWAFWTWCLIKASHKEFNAIVGLQIVHLIPGQFIFGLLKASKETGLTIQEIRTILEFLKKAGNLTIKSTNKFSVITIINWPTYQGEDTNEQQAKQQTTNKQVTTYKHIKNIKTFLSDSIEVRLADFLLEKILSRNPGFKKPDLQAWAKDVDLMIRLDNREPEDIREVITWCQNDTFWQSTILSMGKLRKQYDQLKAKMPEVKNSLWA
ncbi:MAG: hypothetical protein COX51_08975 [Syntrophobacteraceae bacterium CG23_combo_of_CG06-09_8_20_14_all_50_8]|nr:MAG: hypothetical protein COX51_08975 [Syntrophobacteraceae bacterium CG23_combo_of_CG06-09_8_20_14_all_50_8]